MKKILATIIMIAVLPLLAQAAEPAKSTQSNTAAAAKSQPPMEITLSGVTKENRVEVEKLAHKAGAKHASLDANTGVMKVSQPGKFDKAKFNEMLANTKQTAGVSVKE